MHRIIPFIFIIFITQNGFAQCDTLQGEVKWRFWSDLTVYNWPDPTVDVDHMDRYPNGPDYVRTLYSLSAPVNYADWYYTHIRGYIRTPVGGQVVFNLNGDNHFNFKLSTDNTANNLVEINADTSQIASLDTITLAANQYYYFELEHLELTGWDNLNLEWKADFLTDGISIDNWTIVGGTYIYQACDAPCESRGTSCNDGNAATENDQYDGNCNCVGDPVTTNTCIGERGVLQAYLYEGLEGRNTDTLDTAITNGVQPDTVHELGEHFLKRYYLTEGAVPNYGTFIQGYFTVPVTGLYSFNITGSHENHFYLSSDETPANKMENHVYIPWWSGAYLHNNPDYDTYNVPHNQSEENILLETGRYYYFELRHKGAENDWQNFNLYWKTPYQTKDQWLRIPTFYFFDYACETTCIKNGVACNDDDPYTANDQWNGNCNCIGTPCTAPNCDDPLTSYAAPEECETTNQVSNRADDAWLSCTPQINAPNPIRNGQHWIQYDFGGLFKLDASQVWNYNAQNTTNQGFEQVVIDYSSDGVNWEELGTYNWNLAPGTANYEGFTGPDFAGITARYVLITSNDNPNSCRGLSKVAFNAVSCPSITFNTPTIGQTLMDPVDIPVTVSVTGGEAAITSVALYLNGTWIAADNTAPYSWSNLPQLQNLSSGNYKLSAVATDANGTACELATAIQITSASDGQCQAVTLNLTTNDNLPIYMTTATITSSGTIANGASTLYQARESITLMSGFHAEQGSDFTARIGTCTPASLVDVTQSRVTNLSTQKNGKHLIKLYPNPVVDKFTLEIDAYKAGILDIQVYDVLGQIVGNLSHRKLIDKGLETIELSASELAAGSYYCKISIGEESFTKSFIRVDRN